MGICKRVSIVILVGLVFGAASPTSASKVVGRLAFVKGTVLVDKKPATNGQALNEGAMVETKLGSCTILLGKENVFHLTKNSKIEVKEFQASKNGDHKATLNFKYGKTRSLLKNIGKKKKNFKIRTTNAVMGVRGTHFLTEIPQDPNQPEVITVVDGEVDYQFVRDATAGGPQLTDRPAARQKTIKLKQNQSVSVSVETTPEAAQVETLPPATVQEKVETIAPAPKNVQSAPDLQEFAEGPKPPKPPQFNPFVENLPPPNNPPPLDPEADSFAPVFVNLVPTKVKPDP